MGELFFINNKIAAELPMMGELGSLVSTRVFRD
jgi:hypothetical protein